LVAYSGEKLAKAAKVSIEQARAIAQQNLGWASSIWVGPFLFVFENLARLRIHSDFIDDTTTLDVEGVTDTFGHPTCADECPLGGAKADMT
jgi:hypothetical protein